MPLVSLGQLGQWLVRDIHGTYLMDMSVPNPVIGPLVPGLGTNGEEDVNAMTDAANNLLFCTAVDASNEIQVYDASLNQMPNGFGLIGHSSSMKSAICRIPCTTDRYYFIHLDVLSQELYYSTVDMSLNGGLGDVVQKNVLIGSGFNEGLTISHQMPSGCRWLLGSLRNGNDYEVVKCLISDASIGAPAVITTYTGPVAAAANDIKFNAANTKLCMSVVNNTVIDPDIIVWDFDLNTGDLSAPQALSVSDDRVLGLQFSPNGAYIYFQCNGSANTMDFGRVEVSTTVVDIIDPMMGRYLVSLELAANGRIYVAANFYENYMAEVADPDNPVLANIGYTHNAVFISASGCRTSLPNAIQGEPPGSTTTEPFIQFSAYGLSGCDTYQFVDSTCLGTWWEWDFGDGTVTNVQAPQHTFASGTYDITLRVVACGDTLSLMKPGMIVSNTLLPTSNLTFPDTVCAGASVPFTNSSSNATSYALNFGDGTSAQTPDTTHIYDNAGTYTVQLIVNNSCSSDTISAPIVVIESATAEFTISGDGCDMEVVFTNMSIGGQNWLWDLGDGTTSTLISPSHVYASAGTFPITLIVEPGSACSDTITGQAVVLESPVASFSDSVGCSNQVTFSDQSTGGAQSTWDLGDGATSNEGAFTHAYPSSGNYEVTLTSTAQNGCTDDTTRTIFIPTAIIAAGAVLSAPCDAVQVFSDSSITSSGILWDLGDGSSSTLPAPTHTYATSGQYTITLTASPGTPCADTISFTVVVGEHPQALFNDSTGCELDIFLIDESVHATSWLWHLGDGTTANTTDVTHSYPTSGTYIIQLTVSSADGCVDSTTATLDLLPPVQASFDHFQPPCFANYVFTNTSTNATNYSWQFGNGTTSSTIDPVVTYGQSGQYEVVLIASNNTYCTDTATVTITTENNGAEAGIFIPNCFTPNGDGANDLFSLGGMPECFDAEVVIYNRWGQAIHEMAGLQSWDGTAAGSPVPDGVYIVQVMYGGYSQLGHLTVLR